MPVCRSTSTSSPSMHDPQEQAEEYRALDCAARDGGVQESAPSSWAWR